MLILDKKMDKCFLDQLKKLDSYIFTVENTSIDKNINTHPDMLIRKLEGSDLVVDRQSYNYYKEKLDDFNIIKAKNDLGPKYPQDIGLNFVAFKNYFIHKLDFTDPFVKDYYKNRGFEFIDVSQGYTKCSCLLGKNSIITSDTGIYEKIKDKINVLLIDHKHVVLEGYDYGFIGGASGYVNGKIIILGDLTDHPSYEKIINFLNKNKEEYMILPGKELSDYGSIFQI